jgi:hypothetical protein
MLTAWLLAAATVVVVRPWAARGTERSPVA